ALSPAIVSRLGDADLAAHVGDGQPPGQVAVHIAEQSRHLVGGPSLLHRSLRDSVYRGTPSSGGPVLGEQARRSRSWPSPSVRLVPSKRSPSAPAYVGTSRRCTSRRVPTKDTSSL